MGIIYKITNQENNKCYIGQTIRFLEVRWNEHIRKSKLKKLEKIHFYAALKKYDINVWKCEILEDNINTEELLNEREKYWITFYKSFEDGYNRTSGGQKYYRRKLGFKHSEEAKEKMKHRKVGKGNPMFGIPAPNRGKKHSIETIKKLKVPKKNKENYKCKPEIKEHLSKLFSGEGNPRYGTIISEETKKRIAEAFQKQTNLICPFCGLSSKSRANMKRWHFDNCKKE